MVVHVLRNPGANRSSKKAAESVIASLRVDGQRVIDLSGPTPDASAAALATAIRNEEIERLVIAGGDGLVHLAIQHVAQTDVAVTIAPVGTGNDFAAALLDADGQKGGPQERSRVDLIAVIAGDGSRTWAASVATAGFPADITARAHTMDRRWGPNVYALAALLELPSFTRRTFELSIDDIPVRTDSAMLAVGNTKYFGGGMLPCPDALPNDGLVHLTSIQDVGRIGLIPHLLGRAGGTADRKEVLRGEGRRISIHSEGHPFWADGEAIGISPITFEVVSNALLLENVLPAD